MQLGFKGKNNWTANYEVVITRSWLSLLTKTLAGRSKVPPPVRVCSGLSSLNSSWTRFMNRASSFHSCSFNSLGFLRRPVRERFIHEQKTVIVHEQFMNRKCSFRRHLGGGFNSLREFKINSVSILKFSSKKGGIIFQTEVHFPLLFYPETPQNIKVRTSILWPGQKWICSSSSCTMVQCVQCRNLPERVVFEQGIWCQG